MGRSRRRRRNFGKSGARGSQPSQLDGLIQLPQIPDDIIRGNIIPRLPGKSLMRFKCVSKLWNSIISDLSSASSGDCRHTQAVFMSFERSIESYDARFYFVNREGFAQKFSLKNDYEGCIVGSCDGLLLIVLGTSFYLWNPWTTYFSHVLELDYLKFDDEFKYLVKISGICYDPCTRDYKVVIGLTRYAYPSSEYYPVLVARLSNKRWKKLNFPYRYHRPTTGVLFNGFLHWTAITNTDDGSYEYVPPNKIIAFDPKTDQMSEVPLPQYCTSKKEGIILGLGVLEDCLCMVFWDNQVIKVITMKEYGLEESWTPLFEISSLAVDHSPFSQNFIPPYSRLVPLMLMQNGHVLMATDVENLSIFSYNPRTMEYNDNYPKLPHEIVYIYPHLPILFRKSLNSPAGLEWDKKLHQGRGIGYREGYLDSDSEEENYSTSRYPVNHLMGDSSEPELEEFENFMNDHFPHSFFYV